MSLTKKFYNGSNYGITSSSITSKIGDVSLGYTGIDSSGSSRRSRVQQFFIEPSTKLRTVIDISFPMQNQPLLRFIAGLLLILNPGRAILLGIHRHLITGLQQIAIN